MSVEREHARSREFPSAPLVWSIVFVYSLLMALAFQKLFVPLMPGLHAGHGLLQNDAIYFHEVAVAMAERISAGGWSELWTSYPGGDTANVKLLATLYVILGPDPIWFIPFGAALHALAATTLYLLGGIAWPGAAGRLGGLIAAILFAVFPSSLQWYAQNHKDVFAIAGTLLIVYAWLQPLAATKLMRIGGAVRIALIATLGAALIVSVRAYLLQLILVGMLAGVFVFVAGTILRGRRTRPKSGALLSILPIGIVLLSILIAPHNADVERITSQDNVATAGKPVWTWNRSDALPEGIDKLLMQISAIRAHFAGAGQLAGSLVDGSRLPSDAMSALAYAPRALAIGLFAPFPNTWKERPSIVRLIGASETLVWYLLAPGVALFAIYRPSRLLFAGLAFAATVLAIMSFGQPVVGTLYRLRFGVWMFVALIAAIGWSHVLLTVLKASESRQEPSRMAGIGTTTFSDPGGITGIAASGAIVTMIWLLTVLGFLFRDLILVNAQGLGGEIGAVFSAFMIPMFFFTFMSAPLAEAMTRHFLELSETEKRRLVQTLLGYATVALVTVGIIIFIWADACISVVISNADAAMVKRSATMLRWCTPFLMFSAWTVIGGVVLNVNHRARDVALAQLTVPVIAVTTILLFEHELGVYSAILGMLIGMAVNTAIVAYCSRSLGLPLVPSLARRAEPVRKVLANFLPLAIAALFTGASVPLNYSFAGTVNIEALSSWALANKFVQVVTTTAGFAIGAVVLPHLGRLVVQRRVTQLENDTYFLLVAGSWIAGVCALIVHVLSEPLVVTLIAGDKVTYSQAQELSSVLRIGSLQLPFVVSAALSLRLAAVSGSSWRVVIATALGFATNLLGDSLLTPAMGVLGIAMASTAGAGVSATTMLLCTRSRSQLSLIAIFVLIGTWGVFVALSVAFNVGSASVTVIALMALGLLSWMQWVSISRRGGKIGSTRLEES